MNATIAARLLEEAFPQIVGFDATGLTEEQVHYFLGESAAIARHQHLTLKGTP